MMEKMDHLQNQDQAGFPELELFIMLLMAAFSQSSAHRATTSPFMADIAATDDHRT